jgi:hypothetical protein
VAYQSTVVHRFFFALLRSTNTGTRLDVPPFDNNESGLTENEVDQSTGTRPVRHPSQKAPVENSHSGHQFVQNSRTVHLERHVHERAIKNQNDDTS